MAEFLHMGGYAFYVWTSYLLVLVLLLWHYFSPLVQTRILIRMLSLSAGHDGSRKKGDRR